MAVKKRPEPVVTDLHLFRYGDHHNELWTTQDLLYGPSDCASWITQYAWTTETVQGSETGRIARVWVAKATL